MRIHYLFSVSALLFFRSSQCYLQWVQHNENCVKNAPALGNSEFCCNAFCIDGTIAGQPGECLNYDDPCKDVDGPPSCAGGQTYVNVTRDWVNMDGACKDTVCGQPQRFSWAWTCCDCPAGFVSFNHGACALYPSTYSCVGCTDPKELLTGNSVDGFKCLLLPSTSTTSKSSTRTSSTSSTRTSTSSIRVSSKPSISTTSTSSTRTSSKPSTHTSSSSTRTSSKPSTHTSSVSSTQVSSKSSKNTSSKSSAGTSLKLPTSTSSKPSIRTSSISLTRTSSTLSTHASSTSSIRPSSTSSTRASSKSSTGTSVTTKSTGAGQTGVRRLG